MPSGKTDTVKQIITSRVNIHYDVKLLVTSTYLSKGSNYGEHVCDCHYSDGGCMEEETKHNTCNCDANLPVPLSDSGTITNTSALPVVKLFFGGLTYDMQQANFQLGRLKCFGRYIF